MGMFVEWIKIGAKNEERKVEKAGRKK